MDVFVELADDGVVLGGFVVVVGVGRVPGSHIQFVETDAGFSSEFGVVLGNFAGVVGVEQMNTFGIFAAVVSIHLCGSVLRCN